MKETFGSEFAHAARQAPRIFFAPLIGAFAAIKGEIKRVQQGVNHNGKPMQSK